jgi:hypothetical protein
MLFLMPYIFPGQAANPIIFLVDSFRIGYKEIFNSAIKIDFIIYPDKKMKMIGH